MIKTVWRGDIYYADLKPVVSSEEGGVRPVLILSNNQGNRCGTAVIIAPMSYPRREKGAVDMIAGRRETWYNSIVGMLTERI